MNAPELREDHHSYYCLVSPHDTCALISFLRQHLYDFSVDIGVEQADGHDLADAFDFPKVHEKKLIESLLITFFASQRSSR